MNGKQQRIKPYTILIIVLSVYAVVMAYIGRDNYYDSAQRTTYLMSVGAEVVILIGLFFFLRKRYRLRQRRKDDTSSTRK